MECETLMMDLSEQQMLDLWKLHSGYVTPRRDCEIERDDDVELDTLLLYRIKTWYANLLLTAPPDLLPTEDVSKLCSITVGSDGVARMLLPGHCVRPLAVRLDCWNREVTEFHQPGSHADLRQSVTWLRGNAAMPVAVVHGNELWLYSVADGSTAKVDKMVCVVRPADGSYRLSEAALRTIPCE